MPIQLTARPPKKALKAAGLGYTLRYVNIYAVAKQNTCKATQYYIIIKIIIMRKTKAKLSTTVNGEYILVMSCRVDRRV